MRFLEATVIFILVGGGALAACGNSQDSAGGGDAGVDAAAGTGDDAGAACSTAQDLSSDVRHCGSCSNDCTHLPNVDGNDVSCEHGACVTTGACLSGFADCDPSAAGCETKLGSTAACTACGESCSGATPVCGAEGCAASCRGAFPDECSGSCTDTQTDSQNCGACGTVCKGDGGLTQGLCVAGACQSECQPGYSACGGTCVPVNDVNACGPSCTACPGAPFSTPTCIAGMCGLTCSAGANSCFGACYPNDSPLACGPSCEQCPDSATASATCDGTSCGLSCDPGYTTCPNGEGTCGNNLMADATDCGTCGHGCLSGACSAGVCQAFHFDGERGPINFARIPTGYYLATEGDIEHVSSAGTLGTGGSYADVAGTDAFVIWSTPSGTVTMEGPTFEDPVSIPVPAGHAPTSLVLGRIGPAWTDSSGNLLSNDGETKLTTVVATTGYDSPGLCALWSPFALPLFFELANGAVFAWDTLHANAVYEVTQVPPGSEALAAAGNTLYLGDPNGVVYCVATSGGPLTTLTTMSAAVVSLDVDGSGGLYILTTAGLARYDLASGAVTTLSSVGAGTGSRCHALAVSPTAIVWSGEVQGAFSVWAIAR